MSQLVIYDTNCGKSQSPVYKHNEISEILAGKGVRFERWSADADVGLGDQSEQILKAYQDAVKTLIDEEGFQSVDVIRVSPDSTDIKALRQKFLSEHRHTEDEVRMFVDGQGLFYLHIDDQIISILCEKGDLISVPANTPHWFDLGENPRLAAIRFFNNPDGWVAHYSGSEIAKNYPLLDGL